ncbi:MAG: hypothetical protein HYU69_11830 [Bacteroidetes bacterium]|nr:hypothetical protein [Bacteroidota bacterium]
MPSKPRKVPKKYIGKFLEKSIISHKFIQAINLLKQKGEIVEYKDFTERYGYSSNTITQIAKGRQDAPHIMLWGLVHDYNINSEFLFDKDSEPFSG